MFFQKFEQEINNSNYEPYPQTIRLLKVFDSENNGISGLI